MVAPHWIRTAGGSGLPLRQRDLYYGRTRYLSFAFVNWVFAFSISRGPVKAEKLTGADLNPGFAENCLPYSSPMTAMA